MESAWITALPNSAETWEPCRRCFRPFCAGWLWCQTTCMGTFSVLGGARYTQMYVYIHYIHIYMCVYTWAAILLRNTQRGNTLQICVDFGRCMKGDNLLGLLLPQLSRNGGLWQFSISQGQEEFGHGTGTSLQTLGFWYTLSSELCQFSH